MTTTIRRFRISPALVRLAAAAAGTTTRREAHFDANAGRNAHVVFEDGRAFLVASGDGESHERHEVPLAHGEAVADVAKASVERERCTLPVEGGVALVDRYAPSGIDVVTVEFGDDRAASAFRPPAWFGPEVTGDAAYEARGIALAPVRDANPPEAGDAGLDAMLDTLEAAGAGLGREGRQNPMAQEPRQDGAARPERLRAVS